MIVYTVEYHESESLHIHVTIWKFSIRRFFRSPHKLRKNPIFRKKIMMGALSWGDFVYSYSNEENRWILVDSTYGGV